MFEEAVSKRRKGVEKRWKNGGQCYYPIYLFAAAIVLLHHHHHYHHHHHHHSRRHAGNDVDSPVNRRMRDHSPLIERILLHRGGGDR